MDWDIRKDLRQRLETYYENTETTDERSMTLKTTEREYGSKKKQIINAWLLKPEIRPIDLDEILSANYEYIRRVLRELKNREIDRDEIKDAIDEDLQKRLREHLEPIGIEVGEPTTDIESLIDTDATEPGSDKERPVYMDVLHDANKKSRVLNSVLVARAHDKYLTNDEIAKAAECTTQYAQRLTKKVKDGQELAGVTQDTPPDVIREALRAIGKSNKELEDHELEDATPEELKQDLEIAKNRVISPVELSGAADESLQGALTQFYNDEEILDVTPDEEPEPEPEPETATTAKTEQTREPTVETHSTPTPTSAPDKIPASDIEDIRDLADTLYRQARYERDDQSSNKKAEFIAKEVRDRLDELLEQTEQAA